MFFYISWSFCNKDLCDIFNLFNCYLINNGCLTISYLNDTLPILISVIIHFFQINYSSLNNFHRLTYVVSRLETY